MTVNRFILVTLCLMILGLQIRLWIGEGSFAHVSGLSKQVKLLAAEKNNKQRRNEILKAEIYDLRNGLDAVEDKARSELGLIKKGETFFLLVEE